MTEPLMVPGGRKIPHVSAYSGRSTLCSPPRSGLLDFV